ncbi:VENN motif pre-toxin domain-containing protein, partial [Bibersteinia trehalosi]|uniref:VENN motif pre-toxin domain-containing protein n=1 Tax=Bibersteinia trehalosi TaxID=47735 RepID=UPI0021AB7303
MEVYTQGGKACTGAVAAVTGEEGANIISQNLFGKEPENLTEAEKRTVSELSQVAAGLAGGLSASSGSSLFTVQAVKTGQGIGKNAVENNLLAKEDDEYVFESSKIFDKDGSLNEKRKYKTQQLLIKSKEIDLLLQQYQKDPSSLNETQRNYLHNELIEISNSYGISVDKLYNWDFNSGYRRDDSSLSKYLASEYYRQNLSYEAKQGQSMA